MLNSIRNCVAALMVLTLAGFATAQDAEVSTVGHGWGAASSSPELISTRPVIQSNATFLAQNFGANQEGYFWVSAPVASSSLGNGLDIYVDLMSFETYGPIMTDANGAVLFQFILNLPPSVAGEEVVIQLGVKGAAPGPGGWDFEVSNGLEWTFGLN